MNTQENAVCMSLDTLIMLMLKAKGDHLFLRCLACKAKQNIYYCLFFSVLFLSKRNPHPV